MARKRPSSTSGTVVTLQHRSKVLADNPLGDPVERTLGVWLPHEYDRGATHGRGQRFPVLYDLVGFTGTGIAHLNWKPFSENVAERAARLVHEKRMGPAIIVFPDCFTSLGGNQYVNSSAIGNYADFLLDEVIPLVDKRVPHAGLARAPRLLRQVLGRLRRDDPRHEVRLALGRDRQSFRRCVLRFHLSGRLAQHPERAGPLPPAAAQGREVSASTPIPPSDRAMAQGIDDGRVRRFLDAMWKKQQAHDR